MISISIKRFLAFTLAVVMVVSMLTPVFAQGDSNATDTTPLEEETAEITNEDLDVENPGILPTNPFYFLKEFARGFQRFFIFDKVKRAEFEFRVINEKAAEIDILEEIDPENGKALNNAIENYSMSVDRLKIRLEELDETSNNPNIDRLLDKLTERSLRHHQLFDELIEKHNNLRDRAKDAQDDLDDAVVNIDKLKERIERFISDNSSPREIIQAIRFIDRLLDNIESDEDKSELEALRERLVNLLEEKTQELDISIEDIIENWPGGDEVKLRLIDGIGNETRIEVRDRLDELRVRIRNKMEDEHEDDHENEHEDEHEEEGDDEEDERESEDIDKSDLDLEFRYLLDNDRDDSLDNDDESDDDEDDEDDRDLDDSDIDKDIDESDIEIR